MSEPKFKVGDVVRITNGAWGNATKLPLYGRIAEVRKIRDAYTVEVLVPFRAEEYWQGNRSGTVEVKPMNELEPYDAVARLGNIVAGDG